MTLLSRFRAYLVRRGRERGRRRLQRVAKRTTGLPSGSAHDRRKYRRRGLAVYWRSNHQ
jgi:hypothetical protein